LPNWMEMNLIKSIEISYFRSIYKATLDNLGGTTVLFGRNDSGKSNVLRALNLFFNGQTNPGQVFELGRDLCHARKAEDGKRMFVYVKVEFNTPKTYVKSLGTSFWVKKQWSLNSQMEPVVTDSIETSRKQTYLKRLLARIKFHYIPAIKDRKIFESLLGATYQVLAAQPRFSESLVPFSEELRDSTKVLSEDLLSSLQISSYIAPPTDLSDLFRSLDFETQNKHGDSYSLKLQRGDGVQVRHIPAILAFLADNSQQEYHVWGFEEPENSLEIAAAIEEAQRFVGHGESNNKQIFLTSHSPAFFNIEKADASRYFVSREERDTDPPRIVSVLTLLDEESQDAGTMMGETPHLSVISRYLRSAHQEINARKEAASELTRELETKISPILFVEGSSDEAILRAAWKVHNGGDLPIRVESCEGTSKMKALSAIGKVLAKVGSERPLFVVADNDCEGRSLVRNKTLHKGGRWINHDNGVKWCLLPATDDFKRVMSRLRIPEAVWPFTLENLFTPDVKREARDAGVYEMKMAPYDDLHRDNNKTLEEILGLPQDDLDRYYLFPLKPELKVEFSEWIATRAERDSAVLSPLKSVMEELRKMISSESSGDETGRETSPKDGSPKGTNRT